MKNAKKAISLFLSIITVIPLMLMSASAENDYYYDVNERYYFGTNPYYPYDYAETFVSEYGGMDDGNEIPTDFEARTYGVSYIMPNLYKKVYVKAYFYEASGICDGSDEDFVILSPAAGYYSAETGTAVVYGNGTVNSEYGLEEFSSTHQIIQRVFENNEWHEAPMSQQIIIDTTGNYR